MPMSDVMELIALGIDASVVCALYYYYRHKVKDADTVQSTNSFAAGSDDLIATIEESVDKSLPYVCVEGVTKAVGIPLTSQFTNDIGVVQHQLFVEHKSKRLQGIWSDVQRVIRDVTNVTPFQIVASDTLDGVTSIPTRNGMIPNRNRIRGVDVTDVRSAEYLREGMTQTYDLYEPNKDGFASRTLDRVFGELTKGYQQTERMLGVGIPIIGIGRLTLSDGRLRLEPPETGGKYIVTSMSKADVIRSLKSDAGVLKIFLWIFSVLGVGLAAYYIYPHIRRWIRDAEFQRRLARVRAEGSRLANGIRGDQDADLDDSQRCVVCQVERRNVIALDCGHICLCSNCSLALPEPRHCPVCRASINRFLPVYVS